MRTLAQRVAEGFPAEIVEEVVLTGSVSRGVADELSDVEMLLVTRDLLELDDCFELARRAGLEELDSWGAREGPTRRVFGYRETVPIELVWWSRAFAQHQVDASPATEASSTPEALAHGVALRTTGLLAAWQAQLSHYPPELAAARIENAALPWGGFAPAGVLTLIRPDDRLALSEWLVDSAKRVVTIVYALNRRWEPTTKRLAARMAPLEIKPGRLAERIDEALTERDPRHALLIMTELQLDAVLLAPDGPNIDLARRWLAPAADLLRA